MDKKMTLGGFEAVLDNFIPNPDGGFRNSNVDENVNVNADDFESLDDEELEDIKNNNIEVKNKKEKPVEEQDTEEEEIEEEDIEDKSKRKPGRPQGLPDFCQRLKHVGTDSRSRSQCCQYRSASQKGFVIRSNSCGEVRNDLVGESLLIANPFQELRLEWCNNSLAAQVLTCDGEEW